MFSVLSEGGIKASHTSCEAFFVKPKKDTCSYILSFFLHNFLLKSKILTSLLLLFLRSKNNNKHAWASYPLPYKKVLFVSRGKKLQAKNFIYSFTVDLLYSKSAKKKVLRRDTKKASSMQRKKKASHTKTNSYPFEANRRFEKSWFLYAFRYAFCGPYLLGPFLTSKASKR